MLAEKMDMLQYLIPAQEFSLGHHLTDPTPGANDLYTVLQDGKIWYLKNQVRPGVMTGFDMNTFDELEIRQKLTETDWKNPGNFKSFVSAMTPDGGIPWCPRYVAADAFNPPVVIADTSFKIYTAGVAAAPQNVALGQTHVSGPYLIDFAGDVGVQGCMVTTWQWKVSQVMETFYYAGPHTYGWVQWTTSNLVNGRYVVEKKTCFNKIVAGGFGPLQFPYKY